MDDARYTHASGVQRQHPASIPQQNIKMTCAPTYARSPLRACEHVTCVTQPLRTAPPAGRRALQISYYQHSPIAGARYDLRSLLVTE